jgi:cytoskeleton protein RodZ
VYDDADITCGEILRQARERRGLTLQQVAQSTKLPLRRLEALERDEVAALPGGMYRRAQVRAYAEAVGLDPNVALASLERSLEEATPRTVSTVQPSLPSERFASNRTRVSLAGGIAALAAVIALTLWTRQPAAENIAPSAAAVSSPTTSVVPALYAPDRVPGAGAGNTVEPASAPRAQHSEPASMPAATTGQEAEPADDTSAAPPDAESQLTVITEPAGARVTVDGIGWGTAPVTVRYLTPGTKRVRVTREGYLAAEQSIQVAAGPRTTVRIQLRSADAEDR